VRALIETGNRRFRASDEEILDRLILVMVDEAARCLEENIVREPGDVDIGMIFGTGFPPFRGGLLHLADTRGVRPVTDTLTRLSETVSPRFAPSQRLKEMAARGWRFFG
jgi:3-hydroxyacyl-CoA dehydrogenase/enoyl-CoA hydratase/3-hydroxybutyryl-CoA epimerase